MDDPDRYDLTIPPHMIVCATKRHRALMRNPTIQDAIAAAQQRHLDQQAVLAGLRPRLYIDCDGVILRSGTNSVWNLSWSVAPGAFEFLTWATERFACFWLTARCRDGGIAVIEHAIRRALPAITLPPTWRDLIRAIPVAKWRSLKTDGIELRSNWWWIDDSPQPEALLHLEQHGALDRWIETNTDVDPDDLLRVKALLETKLDDRVVDAPMAAADVPGVP